jgi:predicted house-cleaning noncanonical NTP pyrophosphatase (MazG superfamily)
MVSEKQEIDKMIEKQVQISVKEEVTDIYEDLLKTVWERVVQTLGVVTVVSIVDRTIFKTGQKYPFINHLEVKKTGISFEKFKEKLSEKDKDFIKDGLKEMVADFFEIMAKLTGNAVASQLLKDVERL